MPKQTNLPVAAHNARFDLIVLKPTYFLLLVQAIISFYSHAWINGFILLAGAFSVGFIGANLHKKLSFHELTNGIPGLRDAMKDYSSTDDYRPLTSASLQLGFLLGLVIAILLRSHSGWIIQISAFLGIWWLGGVYIAFLFGVIESLYVHEKMKSIALGVITYGIGISFIILVVFGTIMGIRVFNNARVPVAAPQPPQSATKAAAPIQEPLVEIPKDSKQPGITHLYTYTDSQGRIQISDRPLKGRGLVLRHVSGPNTDKKTSPGASK